MSQKRDKRTRELVEYAVGAILCETPEEEWSRVLIEDMLSMSRDEKGLYLSNLTTNAINTLAAIVERAATEQGIDPVSYWASHVKLTAEIQGD